MPRKKKHTGLFKLFGLEINMNTIVTSLIGAASLYFITSIYHTVNTNVTNIKQIPKIIEEQARLKAEYHPEIHPDLPYKFATPTPNPAP